MPDLRRWRLRGMTFVFVFFIALIIAITIGYQAGKIVTVVFYEVTR